MIINFYEIVQTNNFYFNCFFKTETLFSENNLFNVDNIKIEKKDKISNSALADKAIKKGFNQLVKKSY